MDNKYNRFFIVMYMLIMGLINAINNKEKAVPILGNKFVSGLNRYSKMQTKMKTLFYSYSCFLHFFVYGFRPTKFHR